MDIAGTLTALGLYFLSGMLLLGGRKKFYAETIEEVLEPESIRTDSFSLVKRDWGGKPQVLTGSFYTPTQSIRARMETVTPF